ncbi:MAG: ACP S-malonyltransferase [Saprospiraceae bacterium]|nr:ACP S-malonyltransferase [Saprospiraceae bacterium]
MSKTAYLFPGQASQFPGMGKNLYEENQNAKELFELANKVLGFRISDIMFNGGENELKATNITQPAVFIHSVISFLCRKNMVRPDAVAGHSLGEFSALVAAEVLDFESALQLVALRADAMHNACILNPGSMAAIVGLEDQQIESICASVTDEVVVPANYNCPGQLVISGSLNGLKKAEEKMLAAGAKRFILLQVGGAFHSPLMAPAQGKLNEAINQACFQTANCPVFQNVDASPHQNANEIKDLLSKQLNSPVRWTEIVQNMIHIGIEEYYEVGGNGTVLSGFMKRIDRSKTITSI